MDKNFYLIDLYDLYGSLLTLKQQNYFEDYYFDNLSLKEISENYNVSRNAIYNCLKDTEEKLLNYEKNLKQLEKNKKLELIISNLDNDEIKRQLTELL